MRSLLDLGFTTVEVTEFSGTDLLSVRELVASGEVVVIRDEVPRPEPASKMDQWPFDIAPGMSDRPPLAVRTTKRESSDLMPDR